MTEKIEPKTKRFTQRFAESLVAARWWLLAIAAALAVWAFGLKADVEFDSSIEGMFDPGNTTLTEYQKLKRVFGGAEIVLAVYEDSELFQPDGTGLTRLRQRTAELKNVQGVIGVLSLAEINDALTEVYTLGNFLKSKDDSPPILNAGDEMASRFLDTFEGYTHGSDGKTAAIVCLLENLRVLQIPRDVTIQSLREVTRKWSGSRVTGEPVLLADGFRFIRRDGSRLNQICLVLMGVVIVACFRSIRWMLIPVAVIKLSLWLTLATLAILGWKLTMVSSMLSAIIAVISVATVVHITVRYREARLKLGHSRVDAMASVIESLIMPITWTCLTTAAGFFALTLANVEPVKDFGWMMTFGSLFVLVSVVLLVPGLALIGTVDADPQRTWGESTLGKGLRYSSLVITRFPLRIGALVALLMALIASGLFFLQIETDFTRNFREDSEIIRAYQFVEQRMGGAGLLDVVIESPEKLNAKFLERIDRLQANLRALTLPGDQEPQPALSHVVSFADANRIMNSRPFLRVVPPEFRFQAMSKVMPGFSAQMKTLEPDQDGKHYFHIMLRTSQQKTAAQQAELIRKVRETVSNEFGQWPADGSGGDQRNSKSRGSDDDDPTETMTTGFFVLLSNLVNSLLDDQVKTFIAACLFIGIVILLAFGSPRWVLIALIPNILPIVGLLGMLGWLGIRLNMGAAMIAAVSMGLSIDGTIHYLTGYRLNRQLGFSPAHAIGKVQFRTGRALIYSTVALVMGFGSLCISEFIPTVFFGGLVGLSMLGGMLGNLIVLPVLLTLLDRDLLAGQKSQSTDESI